LWYTLKYNQKISLQFAGDQDVVNLMKGGDDHAYVYGAQKGGP